MQNEQEQLDAVANWLPEVRTRGPEVQVHEMFRVLVTWEGCSFNLCVVPSHNVSGYPLIAEMEVPGLEVRRCTGILKDKDKEENLKREVREG